MTFETDIKKLQKMWENGQNNQNNIDDSYINQNIKKSQVIDLNASQQNFNKLVNLTTDWQNIVTLVPNVNPQPNPSQYPVSGFQWTITKQLPEIWLPMVRFAVGYNYLPNTQTKYIIINDIAYPTNFSLFSSFQTQFTSVTSIVRTDPNNLIVTATWSINLIFTNLNYPETIYPTVPDFQAKLYMILLNPNKIS